MRGKYIREVRRIRGFGCSMVTAGEAAELLRKVSGGGEAPVKVIELSQGLGFSVYLQELTSDVRGYILIEGELKARFSTDRVIVVNSMDDAKVRRFTVARALGSYLFNWNPSEITFHEVFR